MLVVNTCAGVNEVQDNTLAEQEQCEPAGGHTIRPVPGRGHDEDGDNGRNQQAVSCDQEAFRILKGRQSPGTEQGGHSEQEKCGYLDAFPGEHASVHLSVRGYLGRIPSWLLRAVMLSDDCQ